jgi:hypothetical protein
MCDLYPMATREDLEEYVMQKGYTRDMLVWKFCDVMECIAQSTKVINNQRRVVREREQWLPNTLWCNLDLGL